MLRNYLRFSQLRSQANTTNKLDLSTITWFYPTLLLPLGLFIKQNHDIEVVLPVDPYTNNYFNIIMEKGEANRAKSYIPIIKIPETIAESHTILNELNPYAAKDCGGTTALQYFIGELVDNIYQHSRFSTAYVMAQKYPRLGFLEFCVIDNGISIPQSYENAGRCIEYDRVALDYALDGKSTKNSDERGTGLPNSVKLLTSRMNGACLIISRLGCLCANRMEKDTFDINEKDIYQGTLISIKVPFQRTEVNIYETIR